MLRRSVCRRFGAATFASGDALAGYTFDLTHRATNQSVPLENFSLYASCPRFADSMARYGADSNAEHLRLCEAYGRLAGSKELLDAAFLANKHQPTFAAFDRFGHRGPGRADFHPAYHQLMAAAIEHRVPSLPWVNGGSNTNGSPFVARGVLSMMHYQLEQGTSCPLTMTCAGVAPLLRALQHEQKKTKQGGGGNATLIAELSLWIEKLTSNKYDPRDVHILEKSGATIGMSMTEKQGGSDVRANTTTATPMAKSGGGDDIFYTLRGHKWFTSAPMCDAFLTLAQVDGHGLTCFLVPRWLAKDTPNLGLQFQRLKDKMGDKSNASSEVEYHDAVGLRVGAPGAGVKTIIEMVNLTRLDCLIGSAALMHRACVEAAHHAGRRSAFGGLLAAKPLMQNVLCDLALEAEAATALGLRMCRAFDAPEEQTFARIGVAIAKYFVCKRAPALAYEAMECLGGNGYTEDFPMARYFRQSPLNAIWEGSGNVIVLDVFRAVMKEPAAVEALRAELAGKLGSDKRLAGALKEVDACLPRGSNNSGGKAKDGGSDDAKATADALAAMEIQGRRIVERTARLLQAAALRDCGPEAVYEAFVESRVVGGTAASTQPYALFGTLDKKFVGEALLSRITPRS